MLDCYLVLFGPIILVRFGLIYLLNLILGLTPFAYMVVAFLFVVAESRKRGAVLIGSSWGR